MSSVFPSVAYQLGIGGVGGFVLGYIIKKVSKLIAVLLGLFILFLLYLGVKGVISINYDALLKAMTDLLGFAGQAAGWLIGFVSLLPFMGSFIAGFLLGFKAG
ncbi:hypothetical protein DRO45_02835 [Candidatus Bathyarchaeota archaeon]|nr:hypothetical protein [Candidatus Bathyarchaeota archaeon]RLI10862.1 MAG: hypothetical protein DRO25_02955 [Candidatus Bathyarchaeota archaeon]RLI21043.1 MAG: hypothetical protein DRO45_02835 [Candidatus Bathyarchaeota archaeon]